MASLKHLYEIEKKSITDIASMLGISASTARYRLIADGTVLRTRADGIRAAREKLGRRGSRAPFSDAHKSNISKARLAAKSKGVSHKNNGYVEFTNGEHKNRSVHRVLMEQFLGRKLTQNEVVHHIDENKHNNSLENLVVMTRSEHASHHRRNNNGKS